MKSVPHWLDGRVVCLLIFLPILVAIYFVCSYGVDVISADQCDGMLPLFQKWHDGTLRFADFWAQHNEHRHLIPLCPCSRSPVATASCGKTRRS